MNLKGCGRKFESKGNENCLPHPHRYLNHPELSCELGFTHGFTRMPGIRFAKLSVHMRVSRGAAAARHYAAAHSAFLDAMHVRWKARSCSTPRHGTSEACASNLLQKRLGWRIQAAPCSEGQGGRRRMNPPYCLAGAWPQYGPRWAPPDLPSLA